MSKIVEVQILYAEPHHHHAPGRLNTVGRVAEDASLGFHAKAYQGFPCFQAERDIALRAILRIRQMRDPVPQIYVLPFQLQELALAHCSFQRKDHQRVELLGRVVVAIAEDQALFPGKKSPVAPGR
ncbi:hypothetical protein D3C84_648580 [compost metagenome]